MDNNFIKINQIIKVNHHKNYNIKHNQDTITSFKV